MAFEFNTVRLKNEEESNFRCVLSKKYKLGIVNYLPGAVTNDEVVELMKKIRMDGNASEGILIVDYPFFSGSRDAVEKIISESEEFLFIVDHHEGLSGTCPTATIGVHEKLKTGQLDNNAHRTCVTAQSNFDPDGVISTFMYLNADKMGRSVTVLGCSMTIGEILCKASYMTDNSSFGLIVFDESYVLEDRPFPEILALAVLQSICEYTFKYFPVYCPSSWESTGGFPSPTLRGADITVLRGYECLMDDMLKFLNSDHFETITLPLARLYLERLKTVNSRAKEFGVSLGSHLKYFDMEGYSLDTSPPSEFWLAVGMGEWQENSKFILSKMKTHYVLALSFKCSEEGWSLLDVVDKLSEKNNSKWRGKETVLFGPLGKDALVLSPKDISTILLLCTKK